MRQLFVIFNALNPLGRSSPKIGSEAGGTFFVNCWYVLSNLLSSVNLRWCFNWLLAWAGNEMASVAIFISAPQVCLYTFPERFLSLSHLISLSAKFEMATTLLAMHNWLCWSLRSVCLISQMIIWLHTSGFAFLTCRILMLLCISYVSSFLRNISLEGGFFDYQSLRIMMSFFSNRQKRTKINNAFIRYSEIIYGVPQGEICLWHIF